MIKDLGLNAGIRKKYFYFLSALSLGFPGATEALITSRKLPFIFNLPSRFFVAFFFVFLAIM